MLIGVISDTHDRVPMIHAAFDLFAARPVEAVIHTGDFIAPFAVRAIIEGVRRIGADVPLVATFGNNDGERTELGELLPQLQDGPLFCEFGGKTILVHHYIGWCDAADISRADIVVTGHTHRASIKTEDGKLLLNAGECCGWVHGACTVAILDTDGPSAEICTLEMK